MTHFIRLQKDADKQKAISVACHNIRSGSFEPRHFDVSQDSFGDIPGNPLAYWISDQVRDKFASLPAFGSEDRSAWVGLQTNNNFQWLRLWWERSPNKYSEFPLTPFVKGGSFSPFYIDVHLGVRWGSSGELMKAWKLDQLRKGLITANNSKCWNEKYYFKKGITWPLRAHRFAPQVMPEGCIFSIRGAVAFPGDGRELETLSIFNSAAFDYLYKTALGRYGFPEFVTGILLKMPWATCTDEQRKRLADLALQYWSLKRCVYSVYETSRAFSLPPALVSRLEASDIGTLDEKLCQIQREIDGIVFDLYGFNESDRAAVFSFSETVINDAGEMEEADGEDNDDEANPAAIDQTDSLLSWAAGVAFGRFDWRLATGERAAPLEPKPFDPLPEKSPGMLPDGEEPFHRHQGFLVDDLGHPHDLAKCVEHVLERVGLPTPTDARRWLQRDFFPVHLKIYSKSKRKAPIYWQIATASGRYSVWLYAPDANADTFFRLQQDVLEPKIANEERALSELSQGGRELSSRDRLEIENQVRLVEELRQLADEVKRVAPLWDPNLDDGTVLTMAPLWRMAGHHKPWQKELQTRWEELQSGKHDWSHQAMHLWPERVVPKCADDRSLAIAHDMEDVFWFEAESGKWAKRDVPTRSVDEIVRERTSDAVKAALKELLEAPEPAATGSRSRRRA